MAANTKGKKVVRKRRERKNVEKGQVHIRSCRATPCPGPPLAAWASAVPVRALLLLLRPPLRRPPRPPWSTA